MKKNETISSKSHKTKMLYKKKMGVKVRNSRYLLPVSLPTILSSDNRHEGYILVLVQWIWYNK